MKIAIIGSRTLGNYKFVKTHMEELYKVSDILKTHGADKVTTLTLFKAQ